MTEIPEWVKVKCAALLGAGLPTVNNFLDSLTPWLDAAIKIGQVGVAVATILYILAKRRKTRKDAEAAKDKEEETVLPSDE